MPASHFCGIVPPHLLQGIASSSQNNESYRKAASDSLAYHRGLIHRALRSATKHQRACLGANTTLNSSAVDEPALPSTSFIKLYDIEEKTKALVQKKLCRIWPDFGCHLSSVEANHDPECHTSSTSGCPSKYRIVFSAENSEDENKLPGRLLRCELQAPADDHQVNDAYDNCGQVLDFYRTVLDWNSIDNDGMHAVSSVHFGKNFDNSLWDSDKSQMVYGDGGELLHDFARCMDVVGHEMTHGVTVFTSPLDYEGQSGSLNEHISDVFGIMIKQWADHETAAVANWLIGEGCFLPDEKGVALRSIRAPGTAYNDPRFGKDPQPDNMSAYKIISDDFGGAHVNSGIPNKAFYLTASAFGGYSWDKPGQIWWKTMNSGLIPHQCTFAQFAEATINIAEKVYGADAARIVRHS